ncbi:putative fumarylacetoacetase [Actinoplanes missouriensis 431]|uniref:fumarylacetoacetase n=1 Tax=Actinoplanes missouriensis (strain ATCC 14538 / DSM 43046 / CBS 188.64 / JCM 3121 / NBRC 102363 / NCIMB 12654 / NRRL B-3342 / UNCC 431) TaxID=512565 RepID=I0H926_ACTM4|nr:fumarylacetoacetase [Actinoplanes missouriensis]BAL89513.1 putative fumarylacetoacetase [Actinoplanes missouriensis 431]
MSPLGSPATLPYGVFSTAADPHPRAGVAIGDQIIDLPAAVRRLAPQLAGAVAGPSLDALLAAGPRVWADLRAQLTTWVTDEIHRDLIAAHLVPAREATMHLPFTVADYVDFYASEQHATNLGRILRPGQEPLTANWKHLPIGYHGRAGTVVVSGTDIVRPSGQRVGPVFGPSQRLDIEAELGFVVGVGSSLGKPVELGAFEEHVFGVCLVNDWSARDIQAFEYVPLGPFLGKSFATSISPWIVPLSALDHARVAPPERSVPVQPYLDDEKTPAWGLDVRLTVTLNGHVISQPRAADMYWTGAQMLAHLTVNGASLRTGDLFASGTISGGSPGSLIELSWNGQEPLALPDGSTRAFLEDGDEVVISAVAPGPDGSTISFGEVRGRIVSAL